MCRQAPERFRNRKSLTVLGHDDTLISDVVNASDGFGL
jgi:hypothetical protein